MPNWINYSLFSCRPWLLVTILLLIAATEAGAQCTAPANSTAIPDIKLSLLVDGLQQPVAIAHANDGSQRLFILEQEGRIRIIHKGKLQDRPFMDIRNRVSSGGERGLLGIAFHPQFRTNGRFFINYTGNKDGLRIFVSEFQANPSGAVNINSERQLLSIAQPYSNHNGGQLAFGPDGYLYIGMGDGGSGDDPHNHGQNLSTLLGSILRIDVNKTAGKLNYAIPADNPYVNNNKARPEIWAWGLRNPWRFSFDRNTGELYAADVGQDETEEIDIIKRGHNYGWRIMEGPHCTPGVNPKCNNKGLTLPLYSYNHDIGRSITGGYVYRGNAVKGLCGTYIYGDFVSQAIWGLRQNKGKVVAHKTLFDPRSLLRLAIDYFKDDGLLISTFGEDEAGEIYVAAYQSGRIYKIVSR
jgi:glucose/arabinose dehydrogenase